MNYQAVLNWIEGWPESALIEGVSADNVIEINVTPNFFLIKQNETFAREGRERKKR